MLALLRRDLFGITLGLLAALLIAPQTGWLVRKQALAVLLIRPLVRPDCVELSTTAQINKVFAQYPNDEQIQYFNVVYTYPDQQRQIAGRRALESRFPDNISLRANILRNCIRHIIFLDRSESWKFRQEPAPTYHYNDKTPHNTHEQLAAYDQDAATGERLDPNNAYFPFMRAIGLYAAHRDIDARAALVRASHATIWNEYYNDEIAGLWRIQELTNGKSSAFVRAVIIDCVMVPHYSDLRQVAYVAAYQAMQSEIHGHVHEGSTLRMEILHIAGLMRAQSTKSIGSLTGIGIANEALQRPGGMSYVSNEMPDLSSFVTYAHRNDVPQAAQLAKAERALDIAARASVYEWSAFDWQPVPPPFMGVYSKLAIWWFATVLLMANTLNIFIISIIATLLARTRTIQDTQPLIFWVSKSVRLVLSKIKRTDINRRQILVVSTLLIIGVAILTVIASTLLLQVATNQWNQIGIYLGIFLMFTKNRSFENLWMLNLGNVITLIIPLIIVLICLITSRIQRVPIFTGLVRTSAQWGLPLVCVLMIIYSGMILVTLRYEKAENKVLSQSMQGEGAYIARMTGRTWPGLVK